MREHDSRNVLCKVVAAGGLCDDMPTGWARITEELGAPGSEGQRKECTEGNYNPPCLCIGGRECSRKVTQTPQLRPNISNIKMFQNCVGNIFQLVSQQNRTVLF